LTEKTAGLEAFFRDYAAASMSPDAASLAPFYAGSFIAAGPAGSAAFQNDERFIEWLRGVHDFNANAGMQTLDVVSVHESRISDQYTLATVEWSAGFRSLHDPARFRISYLLQLTDRPQVLAYIAHEDQETVMRELGLL
jgi:hypothetical protein